MKNILFNGGNVEFQEIQEELFSVLQQGAGMFRTPYQIFVRLGQGTRDRLTREYPVAQGSPIMGEGAGIYYSPASFISHALDYFKEHNIHIAKGYIDSENVTFEGYAPGFRGNISIWAWR
jgi:hypothetical protein